MDSHTLRAALGELQLDSDRPEAWTHLQEIIEVADGELDANEALGLLEQARQGHAERREWDAVARLLSVEVALSSGGAHEAALLVEQGRVLRENLLDEEAAFEVYQKLLKVAPDDPQATQALADSEEKRGRWRELLGSYATEASSAPDDVYKASMLMRAAEMELRFAGDELDPERVVRRLSEAMQLDPTNIRVPETLELTYRRFEDWEPLTNLYRRLLERGPSELRRAAGLKLARLLRYRNDDSEEAAKAYQSVLNLSPEQPEATHFLIDFYSQNERWNDLVKVYERNLATAEERVGDMLQIAMLHYKKRADLADAEPWFDKVRRLEPANQAMLDFFREYCQQNSDDGRLLSVLQGAQRALPDGPAKQALTAEIAHMAEDQKDAQKAIEQYKNLLRQDPDNQEARDSLKQLYKKTQGYNALVELLRQQLERTPAGDSDERSRILHEVASVYRQYLKSDTALVSVLNQILQVEPDDVAAARELVALYEKLGRWRDLLTNQQRLAQLTDDRDEQLELLRAAGRRWLDQFSNVQNATTAYESLLEVEPSDPEAHEKLRELYQKRRAWPALYELYQKELAASEGNERAVIMRQMARLAAERLNRPTDAVRLYQEILETDPENLEVLDALEKLAERSKDWATLAAVLERRSPMADSQGRLAILQKLGPVYADHLQDPDKAASAWRRVLEIQPGHHRALRVLRDSCLKSGDYDSLEQLYRGQNDLEGLAEVLSTAADRVDDVRAKIDLSYRAAHVYARDLEQSDRAFRSYERILSADPHDVRAARALLPIYERDEKWSRLVPLYELLIEHSEAVDEKLELLKKLVDVTRVHLADRKSAVGFAARAYRLAPDNPETLPLLEDVCAAAGSFEPLVEALEARIEELKAASTSAPPDESGAKKGGKRRRKRRGESAPPAAASAGAQPTGAARELTLKVADVYANQLGQSESAISALRSLLEGDPSDQEAGAALENVLRREGRREDLRWLLQLRVDHAPNDARQAGLLSDWATLEEEVFEEPGRAIELYRRVLEVVPARDSAFISLPRLLLEAGDAAGAAAVIEQHRNVSDGAERAELELKLADLYLERLERPADALEAASRALELTDHDARAIGILERLVGLESTRERAAEILAREYSELGDARHEADALMAMLKTTAGAERLGLYQRLADVQQQKLDSYNAAFETTLRAIREFPAELGLWDRAELLSVEAGRPTELADVYREALSTDISEELELELCERAAKLHQDRLGDPTGAIPYLERSLAHDASNQEAFAQLKQILTAAERWGELEELYDKASNAIDDPEIRIELLSEVAMVSEEIVEDTQKAMAYYERILDIDPQHDAAVRALDRLYVRHERFDKLAELLAVWIERASGDEVLGLKLRLARLLIERLLSPAQAIEHVEHVLRERINDYEGRELAERLLEIGSLRARAARILESVYEARDEVRELVGVLEVRLACLDQPADETTEGSEAERLDERKELLRRIAHLRDSRLHDDDGSFNVLATYVPLDPMDVEARARLLEIGDRLGAHARIAHVLLEAADAADTPGMKGEILMEVARLYEERLGDSGRAEEVYRRVLALDETDVDLVLPASRSLERLYAAGAEHAKLAEMLRLQIRLEQDTDARASLQARLGDLCETMLGDREGAIEAYRSRLEEMPGDYLALEALDRLYASLEMWRELVGILEQRQDRASGDEERRVFMRRTAEILADRLDSTPEAIDAWRALVDEFGPEAHALGALEALYSQSERWEELAEAYQRHLEIVDSQGERLDLLARIGQVRAAKLSDLNGAIEACREALGLDSGHAASRAQLEALLDADERLVQREAAEILHPIYESQGEHRRLLHVLEIEVGVIDDPLAKLELLQQALRVTDGPLGDAEQAFGYVERGVRVAAGHADLRFWLDELERLAALTNKRTEQVDLLRSVVAEIFDGDVQFEVTLQIATLARDHLQDASVARDFFHKALELRTDAAEPLMALELLYEEAEEWSALLGIIERRADIATDEHERKALLFRRAELLNERLADKPAATEVYETILDLALDDRAITALETLYDEQERFHDLVALFERQLDASGQNPEYRVKIARIAASKQADLPRAFDELEAALESDRHFAPAIAELERLLDSAPEAEFRARAATVLEPIYLARADYDHVMKAIGARLDFCDVPEERRELLVRLAKLYEEQKEDYAAALETVAKLFHEDLSDDNTVSELERLSKVVDGGGARLAEIYAAELQRVEVDEPATARLAERAGELYRAAQDSEKALAFYRRALAFEPESERLFGAIDELLQGLARHQERVELYRAALDHRYEPAGRLSLLHTIGKLQRSELDQPEQAIETYRSALDVDQLDAESLDALTELYREQGRFDDLAELFLARAENATAAQEAADHRFALAQLLRGELNDTERAIDQLEEIVRSVPSYEAAVKELDDLRKVEAFRPRIVEILRPLYEEADDWRRLIRLNEDRFQIAEDVPERVAILQETASLWEQRGGDSERARRAYGAALELDPEDGDLRANYERLMASTEQWNELTTLYEDIVAAHPDLMSKREYLAKLAEVHDVRRNDPRAALDAYERLRQTDETDLGPVEKMEQLATLLSDWSILVKVLTAKADLVLDEEQRASIWRQVGEAKRDMLDDPSGAVEAYERALEVDASSAFTMDNLINLYEENASGDQRRAAERLVELYQQRVDLTDEEDSELRLTLLRSAAEVYEKQFEDRISAIDMLNRALTEHPHDPELLGSLNRLYEAEKMWPELLSNLQVQVDATEEKETRVALRKQMAEVMAARLENYDDALETYGLVLGEAPADEQTHAAVRKLGDDFESLRPSVAEILVPVLRAAGNYAALVEVLELRLTTETEPTQRCETLRSIAEVLQTQQNDPSAAHQALLRALPETPEDLSLHEELERLAEASGSWDEYARALEERAQSTFDAELAKDLYSRLGRIAEVHLKQDDQAVAAYRHAVEQAGDLPDLLEALDRLLSRTGDKTGLSEILERRIAIAPDDAGEAELNYRLAKIFIEDFSEPARGLGALRQALERVPHHEDAMRAMESLTDDRDLFDEAAEVLESAYRSLGQTDRLAGLYEKRVSQAESAEQRAEMRRDLARVMEEEMGDAAGAQRVLQQGLQDDPADETLLQELERLCQVTTNWKAAADALKAAIEGHEELLPEVGRTVCVRLASWYRDQAGDSEAAEAALGQALSFDPSDDGVLVQLEELQRTTGKDSALIDTLRRRAKIQFDDAQRENLYRQAKDLADAQSDAELAEIILRDLLQQDDINAWALAELTGLRSQAGDHKETLALLLRRVELSVDGHEQQQLRHEAARLARDQLGKTDQAIEIYDQLFTDEPRDVEAAAALRQLYAENEQWERLGQLLERLIDLAETPDARNELRLELAALNRDRFEAFGTTAELLKTVLEEDPAHSEAVVQLSQLYERTERDEELAELLETQIAAAESRGDSATELTFRVRLGEVFDGRLGDRARAMDVYRAVLEREPGHPGALQALARLYHAAGEHAQAAEMLERLVASTEGEERVALSIELADEYNAANDKAGEMNALERVLAGDSERAEIRERLRQLCRATEAWEKLADLISADADAADGADERVKLLREAAKIVTEHLQDHARAAELLEKASTLKPEDRPILLDLCDAYSASGRSDAAIEALERIVASYGGKRSKELGEIHRRLARAYKAKGDSEHVLSELDKAFRIEPGNIGVLCELGAAALEAGDLKKAQQMYRALLLQKLGAESPISKAEVFQNLAVIHERMGEKPKAIQMAERAVQTDANLASARELLEQLRA